MSHVDICRKRDLVDAQTSKTKRSFADIQQNVLRDFVAGSKAHPFQTTGTPLAGICSFGLLISELMLKPFQKRKWLTNLWPGSAVHYASLETHRIIAVICSCQNYHDRHHCNYLLLWRF